VLKGDFLRCGGQARTVSPVDVTAVRGSQLTYCVEVAAELLAGVEEQTVRSVHHAQRLGRSSAESASGGQPTCTDPNRVRLSRGARGVVPPWRGRGRGGHVPYGMGEVETRGGFALLEDLERETGPPPHGVTGLHRKLLSRGE